jgi:hypothetical protein
MLSFTEVGNHAYIILCYDGIMTCYFEASPHDMKYMLCHHLHSVPSIHIHDDKFKIIVSAAWANHNRHRNRCKLKKRGSDSPDYNALLQIHLSTEHHKANFTIHHLYFGKKKTPAIVLVLEVMSKDKLTSKQSVTHER